MSYPSMAFIHFHFPLYKIYYMYVVPVHAGQRYDKDGNLRPWWTDQSIAAFKERQQCFARQYSKYEMFGHYVSGFLQY